MPQFLPASSRLDTFTSYKQLKMERKRTNSYRSYVRKLQKAITPQRIEECFPGLRQRIDFIKCGSSAVTHRMTLRPPVDEVQANENVDGAEVLPTKKSLWMFLDPDQDWFRRRLNVSLGHYRKKSTKVITENHNTQETYARTDRGSCVVCCMRCDQRSKNPGGKCEGKKGRKCVHYCGVCQVYVCNYCWDMFHTDEVPELPPCVERKAGLHSR